MSTVILRPNADGDAHALATDAGAGSSTNYQHVDEAVANDDTDYIRSTGTGGLVFDYYNLDASGLTTEVIDQVDAFGRTKVEGALGGSNGTYQQGIRLSATNTLATSRNVTSTSYSDMSDTNIANPLGGAYTVANVDAMQFAAGLSSGATAKAVEVKARCTQVYATVTYHVASASGTIASSFSKMSAVLATSQKQSGTVASAFPKMTAVVVVKQRDTGAIASSFIHMGAALTVNLKQTGTIASSFIHMSAALVAGHPIGAVASSFTKMSAALTATMLPKGAITSSFTHMSAVLTAKQTQAATIASSFIHMAAALVASGAPKTAIAATFPSMTAVLRVVEKPRGVIAATFPAMSAAVAVFKATFILGRDRPPVGSAWNQSRPPVGSSGDTSRPQAGEAAQGSTRPPPGGTL